MDDFTILGTVTWIGVTWITIALVYGLYNVYLHPLRNFPGPKLWAAYRFPYVNQSIRGQLPRKVLELHREYGPVIRIAPNELAFTQPEAWQDIYGLQPGRVQNQRDPESYTPRADDDHGDGIILADDVAHARLRRILGQAFTAKALDKMSFMLTKYSDKLVEQLTLAVEKNPTQDMSAWYNYTTFDLNGEFSLGEAFHCLDKGGQSHFFMDTVLGGVVIGCQVWQLQRYGFLSLIGPFLPKSVLEKQHKMAEYTKAIVDERLRHGFMPNHADVLNYLLENKRPEDQLPPSEIYENALSLVVAGSETTATLLAGVTSLLCHNQRVYDRVREEVRSAFKSQDEITPTAVNNLAYMIAVLNEALRIFPPSPWGFPRIISSKGGQTVAGHWVPEGTRCDIFHHAASRSSDNFTRPLEFIPERFLPEGYAEFKNDRKEVIQPFSFGPRGCIGKNLAYAEMRMILAKMLWSFDFELDGEKGSEKWHEGLGGYLIWDRVPLKVRLRSVRRD